MERGTGPDAGRVSLNARFDLAYIDDMADKLMRQARELGVAKLIVMAAEKTDSGESRLSIEIKLKP